MQVGCHCCNSQLEGTNTNANSLVGYRFHFKKMILKLDLDIKHFHTFNSVTLSIGIYERENENLKWNNKSLHTCQCASWCGISVSIFACQTNAFRSISA